MAYFAELDHDGYVTQVISISNDIAVDPAPVHSEPLGQAFIADVLGLPGTFVQTSFNGNFRKQYAGIGWRYDPGADVFIAPQPYPSWVLDANHDWQPPVDYPSNGLGYFWSEELQDWALRPPLDD